MHRVRTIFALILTVSLLTVPVSADENLHLPYLRGYPDGTIRPESVLRREELAQILYRLLPEEIRQVPELCWFSDVEPERWSYPAISKAAKLGFVYADTDGCFHPEQAVTGKELALVLTRIANTLNGNTYLPLLAEGWQQTEFTFSAGAGWVMGLRDGRFDADAGLTRAECADILNGLMDRKPAGLDSLLIGMPVFSDNTDTTAPYFIDMQEAAVAHTCLPDVRPEVWAGLG